MITLNLRDNTFRQSECSVAWATPEHVRYVRDQQIWNGVTLYVDGYLNSEEMRMDHSTVKIGWLHEPPCLWPHVYELASPMPHQLDYVFTYDKQYLDEYSGRARFLPYGGVWVPEHLRGIKQKTKLVSFLYGNKMATEGHRIRHEIAAALDRAGLSVDYYGFRGTPTDYGPMTKYNVLADYMFSIVVETCRTDYLFTEILLDCLSLGTIPIFWGCPSIKHFFDERGIWSFATVEECVNLVRQANESKYWLEDQGYFLYDARLRNYMLAKKYAITEDWMYEQYFSSSASGF